MSTERYHPVDAIGNHIRKGDLVQLTLPQAAALFHVMEVERASAIAGLDGKPMSVQGKITVVCKFELPYMPGEQSGKILVVKNPASEDKPLMVVQSDRQSKDARNQ